LAGAIVPWTTHARYGTRAGQVKEGFLSTKLFETFFAERLRPYQERVATLIFEFGTLELR
jgi:hypothetical protein